MTPIEKQAFELFRVVCPEKEYAAWLFDNHTEGWLRLARHLRRKQRPDTDKALRALVSRWRNAVMVITQAHNPTSEVNVARKNLYRLHADELESLLQRQTKRKAKKK